MKRQVAGSSPRAVFDDGVIRVDFVHQEVSMQGEAVVLTVLLGSALKIDGRLILQTQSDGPVDMLVVDFTAPDKVDIRRKEVAAQTTKDSCPTTSP